MQEQIICNKEDLIAIADAVRASTGSTKTYNVPELSVTAVEAIGRTKIYVTPLEFGAVGDGVTDDSDAIQATLDNPYGYDVYFPSNHTFLVTKTLTMTRFSQNLLGCSDNFQSDASKNRETILSTASPVFDIDARGVTIDSVSFISENNQTDDCIVTHLNGEGETMLNVRNCNFKNYDNALVIDGRNVNVRNNLFYNCNHAAKIDYTFNQNNDVEGANKYQQHNNGLRGMRFMDNRFHSMEDYAILVTNGIVNCMHIIGNYMDVDGGLVKIESEADGINIIGNTMLYAKHTPMWFAKLKNANISGNVVKSANAVNVETGGSLALSYPDNAIYAGAPVNVTVNNNVFNKTKYAAVVFDGKCMNVAVNGNVFRMHYSGSSTGGACISTSGNVDVFAATGNTAYPSSVRVDDYFIINSEAADLQYMQVTGNALKLKDTMRGGIRNTSCNIQVIAGEEVSE